MASSINSFSRRMAHYQEWREQLSAAIGHYQAWVEQQGLVSGEEDLRIYELIDSLKSDKLTIALVAEFSRGKTELINAIFFADYKQRLLPTEAGRTTMCPTELQYDEKLPPCIRLLPIETRKTSLTVGEYKRTPLHWTMLELPIEDPRQMTELFREMIKTKGVYVNEAVELGLYSPDAPNGIQLNSHQMIDVPVWRHAIINYPHPLLKQGLVILDTPGLNSLSTEPELTINMLPKAQAVLFVLAADTGVTKSDLEVWNNYVQRSAKTGRQNGYVAVLNKIDTLWDELRSDADIAQSINQQTQETARVLGIGRNMVFPVSAQKGLVGKIKADHALLEKSGLLALEIKLSDDIIPSKQQLMRDKVIREIGGMIENTEAVVDARLSATHTQLNEIKQLGGKSLDVVQAMTARLRQEKQAYDKKLESFQTTQAVLNEQTHIMLNLLGMHSFDELIAKTRREMKESWTTVGLRDGMATFFKGAAETMDRVNKQANQIKGLVDAIYQKFHAEHGLLKIRPMKFSLDAYTIELQRLYAEAEAFRSSPVMVMTEQHFVIKRFFITLVSRARTIFADCNRDAKVWSKVIMTPVLTQIREHKTLLEKRLENLKKIQENLSNMGARVNELESAKQELLKQQNVIQTMLEKINQPLPIEA